MDKNRGTGKQGHYMSGQHKKKHINKNELDSTNRYKSNKKRNGVQYTGKRNT